MRNGKEFGESDNVLSHPNNIFRLRAELAKLRKMYEEQTEKAKNEFMYLHSNKVGIHTRATHTK